MRRWALESRRVTQGKEAQPPQLRMQKSRGYTLPRPREGQGNIAQPQGSRVGGPERGRALASLQGVSGRVDLSHRPSPHPRPPDEPTGSANAVFFLCF